jgi:hypothetical protein
MTKELLLVYESAQVPRVEEREGQTIVALDYEVELDLRKRNIAFISLMDVAESIEGDRETIEHTRKLALQWYTAPEMSFFAHDGVKLGEQHEVVVLYYLQTVVYWVAMLSQVFEKLQPRKVRIFESHIYVPPTADPTAVFKERIPVDVAELLFGGVEVIPARVHRTFKNALSQIGARLITALWNALVSLRKPRPIRIFATDPWSRLEPFIEIMHDTEIVMSRRQEMRTMGLRNAWRTRARFNHRLDFADHEARALAKARVKEIERTWHALEPSFAKEFVYRGVSYWPLAKQVFDTLVRESEDAVATIESTKRMFKHYGINCVLLFASTKGYNNLVACIAERMDIPSIELQHALSTVESTSVHSRLNSRFIAAYGPLTRHIYESWGVDSRRIVECGSPRFDMYAQRPHAPLRTSISKALHIVPQIYYSLEPGNYTSYDTARVMQDMAWVQARLPIELMLRPKTGFRQRFYERKEILGWFNAAQMMLYEPLPQLLEKCDIVISGNSTSVLEALMMHKPVVMYLPHVLDYDFKSFEEAGAVHIARTKEELLAYLRSLQSVQARTELVKQGDAFLHEYFITDGKAGERVVSLIRAVTKV